MPLVVRLRSAVCLLGRFPALAGVDLDVAPGETVLLSGGNGAGKTTLLRLVAGLLPLHQGEGEVMGVNLAEDRRSHRSRVAFVAQDTGCYEDLTVRENLRFATRAAGGDDARVDEAIDALELGRLADVRHGKLSTGQRRRLALAVGIARRPDLYLLDEPHAGLDAPGRAYLDQVLARAAEEGRSVLIASHELEMVRPFASREVVLTNGQADGALDAAGSTPAPAPAEAAEAVEATTLEPTP